MRLFEFEAKELLARFGVGVPRGRVVTDGELPTDIPWPAVVKPQVLGAGADALARAVSTPAEARTAVADLLGAAVAGETVRSVLVEERLEGPVALRVTVYVDRNAAAPAFALAMALPPGLEAGDGEPLARVPVTPLTGLQPHHLRAAVGPLPVDGAVRTRLVPVLENLYRLFTSTGCELLEIPRLALIDDGRLIATEARVTLDRRVKRDWVRDPESRALRTPYEAAAHAAGAVGVEMGGDIAVVSAGAGLLMAICDTVAARGGSLAGILDLGAFNLPVEVVGRLFGLVHMLRPRAVVFNFATRVLGCDHVAKGIVLAMRGRAARAFVRMKGFQSGEGTAILREAGIAATRSVFEACEGAVEWGRAHERGSA